MWLYITHLERLGTGDEILPKAFFNLPKMLFLSRGCAKSAVGSKVYMLLGNLDMVRISCLSRFSSALASGCNRCSTLALSPDLLSLF